MECGIGRRGAIRLANPPGHQAQRRTRGRKATKSVEPLPGKAPKQGRREPYLKPTQVGEVNIHRRASESSLRNSAN